ncbi:reverse transcriptase zinc-binding domain-containing protein [Tanacetum coccineum]
MKWGYSRGRLTTQDRLAIWYLGKHMTCALCRKELDSLNHLFFTCDYSKKVWDILKVNARMCNVNGQWKDTIKYLEDFHAANKIWSVLQRVVIAASVSHIWIERNIRLFQNVERSSDAIAATIIEDVRLKLTSLRVKKSDAVNEVAKVWNIQWNL